MNLEPIISLQPGLGATSMLRGKARISPRSATVIQNVMEHSHFVDPSRSHIGEGDLPGGFRKSATSPAGNIPISTSQKASFRSMASQCCFRQWRE